MHDGVYYKCVFICLLCMYVYTYIYIYIYIHTHIHIYIHVCTCIYTHHHARDRNGKGPRWKTPLNIHWTFVCWKKPKSKIRAGKTTKSKLRAGNIHWTFVWEQKNKIRAGNNKNNPLEK